MSKENIKTNIHYYYYDIGDSTQEHEYYELRRKLRESGAHIHNVLVDPRDCDGEDGPIELETEFLFSNQWNTACGQRVFDWYEGIVPNRDIKRGHYLDITDEMKEIRKNTLVCGYCGKYEAAANRHKFCEKCLGSEYLEEKDLFLLRLLPVEIHLPDRVKLTTREKKHLLPKYQEAQNKRLDIKREKLKIELNKNLDKINKEYQGMNFLLENHICDIKNVIYYSYKNIFCFGWRKKLDKKEAKKLVEKLASFPFEYEIRTLS